MLLSRLQLLFQGYHWEAHGLLCIAALVLFWSIQMLVIWPVLRKNTAENIKVQSGKVPWHSFTFVI